MKSIILLCAVVLAALPALAEKDRGGGGGVCINSKCMTLAEAGLKIDSPTGQGTAIVIPDPAIAKPIFDTYLQLLWKLNRFDGIYNSPIRFTENDSLNTFRRVKVYDPAALARIKVDYVQIMNRSGFPTVNFEIFAISNASETFVLPAFYKLNTHSQALVMIHESLMRAYYKKHDPSLTPEMALKDILAFDSAAVRLLTGDTSGVDTIAKTMIDIEALTDITSSVAKSFLISAVVARTPRDGLIISSRLAALFEGPHSVPNGHVTNYADLEFWQLLQKEQPRLLNAFTLSGTKDIKLVYSDNSGTSCNDAAPGTAVLRNRFPMTNSVIDGSKFFIRICGQGDYYLSF